MDICIAIAFSSTVLLRVPAPLTLRWEHSVEHFQLEEDYRVAVQGGLVLSEVRTQGIGAGIEVPSDAKRTNSGWRYTPTLPPLPEIVLANSGFVGGYRLCWRGTCHWLNDLIGPIERPLALAACP